MPSLYRLLWVVILAVGLTGCVSAEKARKADALRNLGLSYLNEGNLESALKQLLDAKKLNPRDARIRHELGLAFFAKDLMPQAEKEFLAAIRLDPKLTEARLNLGTLYIAQERYPEAITYLEQVTQDFLYRSPARAYNNLGWAYYKMGQEEKALNEYQRALKVAPLFCQALYNAALIYEGRKDLENAVQYLERAVNACPDDLRFRLKLGLVQLKLERRDEAVKSLEMVVKGDPTGGLGAEAREVMRSLK
jgi:tetratricopeptide (TPR) repeat protein